MNKNALITGSSRGIGKATALEFASRGYNVVINYVANSAAAEELKKTIESTYGVRAEIIQADLSKESDVRELAKKALELFGKIDVLVNNAGMALYGDFESKTIAGWEKSMQINLYAPFLLTQLLAPVMAENKYGKIVNISSIDVMTTYNAESAEYDVSKAALINLTKTTSLQFQPYVNVNCICPGWVAVGLQ